MKVLHVAFGFHPDPVGGTEIYVDSLCHELGQRGVSCAVAAPGRLDQTYLHDGLRVRRFGINQGGVRVEMLYGDGDPAAGEAFERVLDSEAPDVVHQHALTSACSIRIARAARQRGIPVVFTYHTPTVTCHRGTLLEWGTAPCDGRLDASHCTACTLQRLGTGRSLGRVLSRVPTSAGEWLGRRGAAGGVWTALRMSALVDRHHRALEEFFGIIDRFVALAPWVGDLLRTNGVAAERIVYSAHGVATGWVAMNRAARANDRLRIIHLGRADPVKGTELLVRALRALDAPVDLDILSVVQDSGGAETMCDVERLAGNDGRIRCLPPLPHREAAIRLGDYDLVAVPSQWMETGPLVVLEAFAAGRPVLGSALGGIADKVRDGVDGLLVRPHDSVEAWIAALERCASDPRLVTTLKRGVRPPKAMTVVATEMLAVYSGLVGSHTNRSVRQPVPVA